MEDKCNKCGRCCYHKLIWQGKDVFTRCHCQYHDPETKMCKDYENRFELGVGCLNIEEAIELKALPSDCPYVEDLDGYVGPVDFEDNMISMEGISKNDKTTS